MSKYGVFLVRVFPNLTEYGDSVFSPNPGKEGQEKKSIFGQFLRCIILFNPLTTNVPNHIETSQCKSFDWFLYDGEHWSFMC